MKEIKTSVSLSLFEGAKTSPILFRDDIEKNIPLIKELGYDGVDLFVQDEHSDKTKKAVRLLKEYNLGVGVVMPAALAALGLSLSDENPAIRDEIVKRMNSIIEFSGEIGAMVSLGLVRGSCKEGQKMEAVLSRFASCIEKLLPCSEKAGVKLVIEPINRYEINTLNSSLEAYDFIKNFALPVGLMLDTFHMNIEDRSIEESFRYCQDLVWHIHFLDSNRLAPSMGHLDMKGIYSLVKELGYEGYLCLEALDKPDSLTCAKSGARFFKSIGL